MKQKAFTLIELLVVIGIIAVLAGIIIIAVAPARGKARDAKRKQDMAQMGQLLYGNGCYVPNEGAGDYDVSDLVGELVATHPQYAQYVSFLPHDPKTGSSVQTNYRYIYGAFGHCALYANLENESEIVNLNITSPDPSAGTGLFRSATTGPNGTDIYYQIAK